MGAKADQPVIETERLILRPFTIDDFPAYAEMNADAAMFRYTGRGAMTTDEAWSRLLRHAGHWTLLGHGFMAAIEKASDRFVGEIGLGDFKRGLGPEFDGAPEAGWAICPWAQGRGYASEAATAALAWHDLRFGRRRAVCLIHVDNAASFRIADRLGFHRFGTCTYRGYRAVELERPAYA